MTKTFSFDQKYIHMGSLRTLAGDNVKPINPEKITGNLTKEEEPVDVVVETRPPIQPEAPRPSYDTPMTRLQPTVTASLQQAYAALPPPRSDDVVEGESCKNNGEEKEEKEEKEETR